MERVFTRVAGLDVHKDVVVACVRTPLPDGRQGVQTASFGATTEDLLGLRDWLVGVHQLRNLGYDLQLPERSEAA